MIHEVRYALDFAALYQRGARRDARWAGAYKDYLNGRARDAPLPRVVQLVPTEGCNLRCPMCNQWGENGYFLTGKRAPSSMPRRDILSFLEQFRARQNDFLLSVHGGEPFLYAHMDALIDHIARWRIDTSFSTNGTRFEGFLDPLARINPHALHLLSIDGGRRTNDRIRGEGTTETIIRGVKALGQACRERGTGRPKIIINYCVNEHNPEDVDEVLDIAREIGARFVNYNLRWFLPRHRGEAYDRYLCGIGVRPSGAWTGWVTDHSFEGIETALDCVYSLARSWSRRLLPPFVSILPRDLSRNQASRFYHDYDALFGLESCVMPSYWIRIHSNGDLIYCPGHPDIIPGNVFEDDFDSIYRGFLSRTLRERVERDLLDICNRCCGLYMTYSATRRLGDGWVPRREPT